MRINNLLEFSSQLSRLMAVLLETCRLKHIQLSRFCWVLFILWDLPFNKSKALCSRLRTVLLQCLALLSKTSHMNPKQSEECKFIGTLSQLLLPQLLIPLSKTLWVAQMEQEFGCTILIWKFQQVNSKIIMLRTEELSLLRVRVGWLTPSLSRTQSS